MGKSPHNTTTKLQQLIKTTTSTSSKKRLSSPTKPLSKTPQTLPKSKLFPMEGSSGRDRDRDNTDSDNRVPLSQVVSDCVKRWFKDTLKEAKAGDINMQVLVGQMYYSGYGVIRDAQKGKIWMTRASRTRSSAWKVSNKQPGYNASDSDSDE